MRYPRLACLWIVLAVLILDAISKFWVHISLPIMSPHFPVYPYGGIPVFENFLGIEFSLTHLTNRGAAWGVFQGYQDVLLGVRIFLILAMIVYLLRTSKPLEWLIPIALVIAGALGNVIDYFVYGHVVDMFHFIFWGYDFPVLTLRIQLFVSVSVG